jgi:hypothetical protein
VRNSGFTGGSATITVNPLPTVTFTTQPGASACIGVDVTYTTQASMTSYVWGFPGVLNTDYSITSGGTGSDNTVTLKYLTTGSKNVTINYTNSNGCTAASATSSTATTINPLPVAPTSAGSDRLTFCADDAGDINLSVTGGSGTTVRWFTGSCGGTDIGTGNPLTIASPTTTTTYYARWENSCGNSTCESVTVTVFVLPAANVVNITCAPDSINGSCSEDICQGLNGTTFVDFRFDRISGTGDWNFDFTIGGTDVSVLNTTVTGDLILTPPTLDGNTVHCGNNSKVYLRFEIDNVPNQTLVVSFSLDYIEDTQCSDFTVIEAAQTINPIPVIGPFN